MRDFLILVLIFLAALFQTTIWGFNFLLLMVLMASLARGEAFSLSFAFLAGLSLDLLAGSGLGFSSLAFVLISFLVWFSRQGFSFQNPLSCFALGAVSALLFSFLVRKPVSLGEGFLLGVFFLGLRFFFPLWFKRQNEEPLRLEV